MTGPEGNSEFCFPKISMFPETKKTLRFEGSKIQCSLRDQSLSDLLESKTKQKQILNVHSFNPSIHQSINRLINQTNKQSIKENQTEDVRGLIYSVI